MTHKSRRPARKVTSGLAPSKGSSPSKPAKSGANATQGPAFAIPGVQTKLAVGKANSPFEREADRVADTVIQGGKAPGITPLPAGGLGAHAQRASDKEETETEETDKAEEEQDTQAKKTSEEEEKPDEEPAQTKMAGGEEEEEAAQEKSGEGEEKEEEEEAAQAKSVEGEEEEKTAQPKVQDEGEQETAQKKTSGAERDRSVAQEAVRTPGRGDELASEVRGPIERSTGADLSDVQVHQDGRAARAAESIGARAFTHGRDIWLGASESARDTRLMAHEAAHVIQQTGTKAKSGASRARQGPTTPGPSMAPAMGRAGPAPLQRAKNSAAAPPAAPAGPPTGPATVTAGGHSATLATSAEKSALTVKDIRLPAEANKQSVSGPLKAKREKRTSAESKQRSIWKSKIKVDANKIKLNQDEGVESKNGTKRFFLKVANQKSYVIGTPDQIAAQSLIPNWAKTGKNEIFEVDHIHEVQLSGDASAMSNFQLLDPATNGASGSAIQAEIRKKIAAAATKLKAKATADGVHPALIKQLDMDAGDLKSTFKDVTFQTVSASPLKLSKSRNNFWLVSEIQDAKHINTLKQLTKAEANKADLVGSNTNILVMLGRGAGKPRRINLPGGLESLPTGKPSFKNPKGLNITGVQGTKDGITSFSVDPHGKAPKIDSKTTQATPSMLGGDPFSYSLIDLSAALKNNVKMVGMSPIDVKESAIENDRLVTRAVLLPTSKIFRDGLGIDLAINGHRLELSKTFSGGDFDLPGPINVTGSELTLTAGAGAGGASLSATGKLDFEVERVGKGYLEGMGRIGAEAGFSVKGGFEFDPALFKGANAKIDVAYANDKFTGKGTLKIGSDQIKGIQSATLNVTVEDETWEAAGTVVPKVPGVSEGSLSMKFDPKGGFEIAGELTLGKGIPRLKSGKLKAKLVKESEAYKLSGSGDAELDIPGVAAKLSASYDDGKFKAEASAGYARGIASGKVTVGATNMPVDPETGKVSDGDPGDAITIFGSGSVTIKFTPWLQGTAGLKIKADGSMEVKGKVELPDSIEVFPEKKLEKELLSVSADIPIVGVAVAGQRIGIFLNITGGLTAKASIGPGELKNVSVEVTYNPEDESSAKITGSARFEVPAEAGLRLTIQGALGAGIPVVSARAGLELGAELGVKGLASANAEVEWTPSTGISMEADVGVKASPQFTFDVTGFADVKADLWLTTIELYSKRWKLASFTYGSGMEVGAKLKVKVENNEVKPISMNDVEITKPDIDPMQLAKGVIKQVV